MFVQGSQGCGPWTVSGYFILLILHLPWYSAGYSDYPAPYPARILHFQQTMCSKICPRLWYSVFQALVHTVPNLGEILEHSLEE